MSWTGLLVLLSALGGVLLAAPVARAHEIAITLDDLPIWESDVAKGHDRVGVGLDIVKAIRESKMPAPYGFVNATQIDETPATAKILEGWKAAGFLLGNHTYSHPHLNQESAERFVRDIRKNEPALARFSPSDEYHVFRYPFLDEGGTAGKHAQVRQYLARRGYRVAEVTIDFNDWAYNDAYVRCLDQKDAQTAARIKAAYLRAAELELARVSDLTRVVFGHEIKQILLLHMNQVNSELLPKLFALYEKLGTRWVSLDEAMQDPAYELAQHDSRSGHFVDKIAADRKIPAPTLSIGAEDPLVKHACKRRR